MVSYNSKRVLVSGCAASLSPADSVWREEVLPMGKKLIRFVAVTVAVLWLLVKFAPKAM